MRCARPPLTSGALFGDHSTRRPSHALLRGAPPYDSADDGALLRVLQRGAADRQDKPRAGPTHALRAAVGGRGVGRFPRGVSYVLPGWAAVRLASKRQSLEHSVESS